MIPRSNTYLNPFRSLNKQNNIMAKYKYIERDMKVEL